MNSLAELFFRSAQLSPKADALHTADRSWSYQDLKTEILGLYGSLAKVLQPNEVHCGIFAHKSAAAYISVLAILANQRAYVPLNPAFPTTRNAYILQKSQIQTIVLGIECLAEFKQLLQVPELADKSFKILFTENHPEFTELLAEYPTRLQGFYSQVATQEPDFSSFNPNDVAYILFTSGSTGNPKGVQVTHQNVLAYVKNFLSLYEIKASDRLSQTFDLTFDLSVHDQFVTWAVGASLVPFSNAHLAKPLEWAAEKQISIWFSVPSIPLFLENTRQVQEKALPHVRLSFFCGEKLTWNTTELWKTIAPDSRLINLYGPTEATIAFTHYELPLNLPIEECLNGVIPVGFPYPAQEIGLFDENHQPVTHGMVGELWVCGNQVTLGYLGEPALTAEKFVTYQGRTWYRTGDLVQMDTQDRLQFVGRVDFQVKVMGYRIELGEIEHVLMKQAHCPMAIADVYDFSPGMDELFCVLPTSCKAQKKTIRQTLKDSLPHYMVPKKIFFMDHLPLNANGKISRSELKKRVAEEYLASE